MNLRILFFIMLLHSPFSNALDFESGEQKVSLLELYTSEGCSSCPPADRWLSELKSHEQLWNSIIPIAFHVDYWDYIGWKDPFADNRFSQRQRNYAKEQSLTTVYTPGFMLNGKEWRRWRYIFDSDFTIDNNNSGNLKLSVKEDGSFNAEYLTQQPTDELVLNIAILGMNLSSKVQRGENRGRKLQHDFVVLELQQYTETTNQATSYQKWQDVLPKTEGVESNRAIAAWVSKESSLVPIQATGGYLN